MDRTLQGSKSITARILDVATTKGKAQSPSAQQSMPRAPGPVGQPQLSSYILTKALKRPEGVSFTDLVRALLDAKDRASDKSFRSQLPGLLLRLSYYEEIPSDVVARLVPLFYAYIKDAKVVRSLFYLCGVHASRGSAGTPTLLDTTTQGGGHPDPQSLQAIFIEAQRMLEAPDTDPAVRRAAGFLLAAAGRSNEVARKEGLAALERLVNATDALASAGGSFSARGKGPSSGGGTSATNWELQHTIFGAVRFSDTAAASSDIGRSCFLGLGSPDPTGARHSLALAAELALRDPSLVMHELSMPLAMAADLYEAAGPAPPKVPGTGINLEDAFARLHLARACAAVLHSDQGASDVGRGGGPFWSMLCMLGTRDPSDLVRFGALEALTGAVVLPSATTLSRQRLSEKSTAREATVLQQRRARAWRLLVSQAAMPVTIPGVAAEGGGMKLIEVIARLLLLALNKVESAARFCVAASVASSLAESCLASQSTGNTRHITSPDVERVMGILSKELGSLIESPLRPAQRCGCIEALLYLQASGYHTNLTPAKLSSAGGRAGGAADGVQDALLTAVLKCAKARPKDAGTFLGYASGVVGISPSGISLKKVTELWDAAAAAGKEGKTAALVAALETLRSPPPPATRPRAGAGNSDVVRAARAESGWNAFVATAAWWLGEHANEICEEYAGRKVAPPPKPAGAAASGADGAGKENDGAGSGSNDDSEYESSEDAFSGSENGVEGEEGVGHVHHHHRHHSSAADQEAVLNRQGQRNPALSRVIASLHDVALTATWQLRAAAARALAKIAVRSGEPFRLQVYGILTACAVSGGVEHDALGLQGVVAPALILLDKIYATQVTLDALWEQHGDDVEGWPQDILTSLARRSAELRVRAERTVCSVPRERYALLGPRAVTALAFAQEEGPAYASFLQSEVAKAEGKDSRTKGVPGGPNLAVAKNKEVEDILSFGGSETSSVFKPFKEQQFSPRRKGDHDTQIENLLSADASSGGADAWAFSAAVGGGVVAPEPEPSFNAFAETTDEPTWGVTPSGTSPGPDTPMSGAPAPSPRQDIAAGDAAGTARVMGSGTMAHTFIADALNPEELSIFEGDSVEVLEESDGWMLVRDPSGSQGLVPTAYVRIEKLLNGGGGGSTGGGGGGGWGASSSKNSVGGVSSPTSPQRAAHSRGASMSLTNEDFLDRFFSGATSQAPSTSTAQPQSSLPGMPEGQVWADFSSAVSNAPSATSPRSASGSPHKGSNGQGAALSRFSPVWQTTSSTTAAATPVGNTAAATTPPAGEGSNRSGGAGGGGGGTTTGSNSQQAGNPFNHRRMASQASSHQRTLSAGSDPWGSMPGTPGAVEGPERSIVAPFVAEMEGELTVEIGERVKVATDIGGWARVLRLSDARAGLVPSWAVGEE